MIELAVALIGAAGACTAAYVAKRQDKKIAETHKQVSQNSHKNAKPTVLDIVSDILEEQKQMRAEQRKTNEIVASHLEWHLEKGE